MAGGSIIGWILLLSMIGLLMAVGWWQWKAYVTLDRRIEQGDGALLHSASTRVETVLDAPLGSVVVPYVPAQLVPAVQQPPNQPPLY